MNRKLSVVLLTAMMVLVVSCKDTDEVIPELSVTPSVTDIVFAADGVTLTAGDSEISPVFTILTNQSDWDVQSDKEWLSVYRYRGNGFMVMAQPNSLDTPKEAAEIIVTAGNAAPVKIKVQQLGIEE